ncbi:MAG: sugar phosphate isomerase/epimerase family protein [Massiliimalia sp.]|jgi:sugar phosphate isomerase/epimerase
MLKKCIISGFADEICEDFDTQLKVLQSLSMSALELRSADGINVSKLTGEQAKTIKKKLDGAGITVSSVGSPIGKIEITQEFAPHFEDFRRTVETAHILGTRNIRMFSFFIPEGEKAEDYREPVLERLTRLKEYAKQEDVVLLHENEKEIYGDTAKRCLDLMEQLADDHFQAVFDFANFVQCKQNPLEAFQLLKDYIAYIHVKDAKWEDGTVVPAGQGDGCLREVFDRLDQAGYTGYLSLEPHLVDFVGLQNLEKHAAARNSKNTGEAAFTIAYEALCNLLKGQ